MSASLRIGVVDFGAGNLRSVAKALLRSGMEPLVTGDPERLRSVDAVCLPGVGAFADAMAALSARGLDAAVVESIGSGRPYLGLCLGLQVLFDESVEHGKTAGLGLLPGRVVRFARHDRAGRRRPVPHIGWNEVRFSGEHPVCAELPARSPFYFVHSYYAEPAEAKDAIGVTEYGDPFTSAVARDNVVAVQFHPEKSQSAGHRLLDAVATWMRSMG